MINYSVCAMMLSLPSIIPVNPVSCIRLRMINMSSAFGVWFVVLHSDELRAHLKSAPKPTPQVAKQSSSTDSSSSSSDSSDSGLSSLAYVIFLLLWSLS